MRTALLSSSKQESVWDELARASLRFNECGADLKIEQESWGKWARQNCKKEVFSDMGFCLLLSGREKKLAIDLGSGNGCHASALLRAGFKKVIAVDFSPVCIEMVKKKVREEMAQHRLETFQQDIFDFQFPKEEKAQLILAIDLFEFCEPVKLKNFLEQIYDSLEKGGFFLVSFCCADSSGQKWLKKTTAWSFSSPEKAQEALGGCGFEVFHMAQRPKTPSFMFYCLRK